MKIIPWIKNNRLELLVVLTILIIAAFLRFYRISEYMTFLGDEGRDALMIKRILVEKDFPLIGPPTSIGNIYLGPLYYYMMAIPMAIFWLNPVAAAGMVATLGVASVGLVYFLARQWFGKLAAWCSALLYTLSPVNIVQSHSSWNPNPAPFFALLSIIGLLKSHRSRDFRWLILSGLGLAFIIQMHYLALILLPVVGILWVYDLSLILRKKLPNKHFVLGTILAVVVFCSLMSPLVIFDFKYNFLNYRAISTFFLQRETTVNLNPFNTLERTLPIYKDDLVGRYITGENPWVTPSVSILILIPLAFALWKKFKGEILRWSYLTLGLWLIIGILGLSLYKQSIFDHYLGFLNPVPFLLLGALTNIIFKMRAMRVFQVLLIIVLIAINLKSSPLQHSPNNQLKRTQDIAKFVIYESGEKPFNFALIAKNNYDAAYQFYLDLYGYKPKFLPSEITDQLFVVCEDPICEPIGHPKYEIAAFGWAKIEKEIDFSGVKVFKLVSNPSGKP